MSYGAPNGMSYPAYGLPPAPGSRYGYPAAAAPHPVASAPYAATAPSPYMPPAPTPYLTEQFRQHYRHILSTLTFNSRPIIQNASILALERRNAHDWDGMTAVAQELERAIAYAPPQGKLPLLYLLDSIAKNVGPPYTSNLFPSFLGRAFLDAYFSVEGVVKNKMEEMLATWRTGGPGRTELFGPALREEIERGIFGGGGASLGGGMESQVQAPPREHVLASLANAMHSKRSLLAREPGNPEATVHLGVLEQIQRLLSSSQVSPQELVDIQEQLDRINRSSSSSGSGPGPISGSLTPLNFASTPSNYASTPIPQSIISPSVQHALPAAPAAPPLAINYNSLLQNLAAAGVFSATSSGSGTPNAAASSTANAAVTDLANILDSQTAEGDSLEEYENMILGLNVQLTMDDLKRSIDLDLTAHLPHHCSQCAARFPAGERGKERLQSHLDWHFRRNRKERESEGRGANRRWLPRADFWINDVATDAEAQTSQPTEAPAATAKIDRAALMQQWIVAPTDPTLASAPCPICKEKFTSEYSEDEEEWIWKNAVVADNKIFHATCRAESAAAGRAALVVSGHGSGSAGTETRSRSRSASPAVSRPRASTPQPGVSAAGAPFPNSPLKQAVKPEENGSSSSRATTPGVKRKADDEGGPEVKREKP